MQQTIRLVQGDCLKVLPTIPEDSVDLVCTDPPYGLEFMGKDWDKAPWQAGSMVDFQAVNRPDVYKDKGFKKLPVFRGADKEYFDKWYSWTVAWAGDCLRVMKPGAFAFVMSSPRSDLYARYVCALMEAGFEVGFTPIFWAYATGFPKATNISKAVDKKFGMKGEVIEHRVKPIKGPPLPPKDGWNDNDMKDEFDVLAPASPEAKGLNGSYAGFQPKPAVEVIIVAMKPLSEKTYVEQALKNGKGVTWLDDARIPFENEQDAETAEYNSLGPVERFKTQHPIYEGGKSSAGFQATFNSQGRFPANLLVSDDVLNDGKDHPVAELRAGIYGADHTMYGGGSGMHPKGRVVETTTPESHGSFSRYFDLDKWA